MKKETKKEVKKAEVAAKSAKIRKYKRVLAEGKVFVPGEGMVVDQVSVAGGTATVIYHKEVK